MPGIFISYRREDSAGHTGRLFDTLRARLGRDRVFMDVTGIEAGVDFVDTIERAIGSCDTLLAVIGPEWLSATDTDGRPRLEDPADFIRIEISAALNRQVRVVPVLIAGASMPPAKSLPDDLKPLARRQAVELRDSRWDADINDLIAVLERVLARSASPPVDAIQASAAADMSVRPSQPSDRAVKPSSPLWRWALPALAVSLLAVVAVFVWNSSLIGPTTDPDAQAPSATGSLPVAERPVAAEPPPSAAITPAATLSGGGVAETKPASPDTSSADGARATRVPRVEGLTLREATQSLRKAGLAVGTQESVSAPGVAALVVTRQTPPAGSLAPRDGRVNLVYARPARTLPAVVGRTLDQAVAELRDSGFVPGLMTARPDRAPARQVLEQSRPAGVELEPGTTIDLVYAAPLPSVIVPNFVGIDVKAAPSALEDAGLVLRSRRSRATADVPPGQVVDQSPPSGASVDKGAGVALVYATRRGLKVPNVEKLSVQDARALLERSGFTAQVTYEATGRAKADTVLRQLPPPDSASTSDTPVVDVVVARSSASPASAVSLSVYYDTDAQRQTAQELNSYLAPYKLASYLLYAVNGRKSTLSAGVVHYARPENERIAQSIASRAGKWLSDAYGQPVTLTLRLDPRVRPDGIVLYLPSRK